MANLKALNLHVSFQVGGNVMDDPENIVGYSENVNFVLDFGNEKALEQQLTDNPWLADIVKPVIEKLHAQYDANLAEEAKPKAKSAELKKKLKGLV